MIPRRTKKKKSFTRDQLLELIRASLEQSPEDWDLTNNDNPMAETPSLYHCWVGVGLTLIRELACVHISFGSSGFMRVPVADLGTEYQKALRICFERAEKDMLEDLLRSGLDNLDAWIEEEA